MISTQQNLKTVTNTLQPFNVPFNKPYITGREEIYVNDVIASGKLCGNGPYTKRCHQFFKERYGFNECLLTTSCTDALEMAALLLDLKEGDEVIMPSYTFVSTANAFMLRGANIVFADSRADHPGIDENKLEQLITPHTRAIVVVHYAGVATDMDKVMEIANKHGLYVVEDAAQGVDSYYNDRPLGSIGHLAAMSFHETKNIVSGEGGLLVINDKKFVERAEIIREKGTDRSKFMRGEIDKYGWVDIGSSFLPSEMIAAFLYAQLEGVDEIQQLRLDAWQNYYTGLLDIANEGHLQLMELPGYARHNAHMFYIVLPNEEQREALRIYLKEQGIAAVFHYSSLHAAPFFAGKHQGGTMPESDRYSDCLLRLPLFADITAEEQEYVMDKIREFYA